MGNIDTRAILKSRKTAGSSIRTISWGYKFAELYESLFSRYGVSGFPSTQLSLRGGILIPFIIFDSPVSSTSTLIVPWLGIASTFAICGISGSPTSVVIPNEPRSMEW